MAATGSRTKGLMIAAALIAGWVLIRGINFATSIDLIPKKIRFGGSFLYPEAYITFTLINPTDVSMTVDNIMGSVMFKNQEVAGVSATDSVQVSGHQAIDVEVRLVSKIGDLFSLIGNAIQGNVNNNILFTGFVTADGIQVPVRKTLV